MIDYKFIISKEGGILTDGYVPNNDGVVIGQSGVTVGCGVDLGNFDVSHLDLAPDLISKMEPYLGIKGQPALAMIKACPLKLEEDEARHLSYEALSYHAQMLKNAWRRDSDIAWGNLTKRQKTVLLSVSYQYGNLPSRTPKFWRFSTQGQWDNVIQELWNFGDDFANRRHSEAQYLLNDPEKDRWQMNA